jgi:hypothetical protein
MSNSTLIVDYIGRGLDADKPSGAPPIAGNALAAYYAIDTGILYLWNNSVWTPFSAGEADVLLTATKTSNYNVLASDSGTVFDNTGAGGSVTFTLPTEANGLYYGFTVVTTEAVVVAAPAGVQIGFSSENSIAGGNIQSATPFSSVEVYAPKGATTQWVARAAVGSWTVN